MSIGIRQRRVAGRVGTSVVPCHAFENLQYTGAIAASVKLTISHSASVCGPAKLACLTVTTSPDDPAADISWNLTPAAPGQPPTGLDTLGGILYTLEQRGVFSVTLDANAKSTGRQHFAGGCDGSGYRERGAEPGPRRDADGDGGDELGRGVDEFEFYRPAGEHACM